MISLSKASHTTYSVCTEGSFFPFHLFQAKIMRKTIDVVVLSSVWISTHYLHGVFRMPFNSARVFPLKGWWDTFVGNSAIKSRQEVGRNMVGFIIKKKKQYRALFTGTLAKCSSNKMVQWEHFTFELSSLGSILNLTINCWISVSQAIGIDSQSAPSIGCTFSLVLCLQA